MKALQKTSWAAAAPHHQLPVVASGVLGIRGTRPARGLQAPTTDDAALLDSFMRLQIPPDTMTHPLHMMEMYLPFQLLSRVLSALALPALCCCALLCLLCLCCSTNLTDIYLQSCNHPAPWSWLQHLLAVQGAMFTLHSQFCTMGRHISAQDMKAGRRLPGAVPSGSGGAVGAV